MGKKIQRTIHLIFKWVYKTGEVKHTSELIFFHWLERETNTITLALADYMLNISNLVKWTPGMWRVLINMPESNTNWILLGHKEIKGDWGLSYKPGQGPALCPARQFHQDS